MAEVIETETYYAIEGYYKNPHTGERKWKVWNSGASIGDTVKAARKTMKLFLSLFPDDPEMKARLVRVTLIKEILE
jgi:uncharacterized protein (DUF736 family)